MIRVLSTMIGTIYETKIYETKSYSFDSTIKKRKKDKNNEKKKKWSLDNTTACQLVQWHILSFLEHLIRSFSFVNGLKPKLPFWLSVCVYVCVLWIDSYMCIDRKGDTKKFHSISSCLWFSLFVDEKGQLSYYQKE